MNLKEDFEQSGLSEKEYLKQFWDETNLIGKDWYSKIDDFTDAEEISEAVKVFIDQSSEISEGRREYYKANLDACIVHLESFLEENLYRQLNTEEAQRENLEKILVRILRGEFRDDKRKSHRVISEANELLKKPVKPFKMSVNRFVY